MPASVYEPISTVLKNSFYGPKRSPGLSSKMDSSLQKNMLVPVRQEKCKPHYDFTIFCIKVQFDDPIRQTANLSEKQKSKYVILTTVTSNGDSAATQDSKAPVSAKLDQVPEPRMTLFRRDQVELGYRGPAGPGSGMFNMGNTCYLNSTLQVRNS